jgi:hypothetical protein
MQLALPAARDASSGTIVHYRLRNMLQHTDLRFVAESGASCFTGNGWMCAEADRAQLAQDTPT